MASYKHIQLTEKTNHILLEAQQKTYTGFKINIYIGWLFRLIPLLMGITCITLGEFVSTGSGQNEYFVAGHVLTFFSAICLALFTTVFIIISQLTYGMNKFHSRSFPVIGYAGPATTTIWRWLLLASNNVMVDEFVTGHVIFDVGVITTYVSIVATPSGHFLLIPRSASGSKSDGTPSQVYPSTIGNGLIVVSVLLTLFGFIWSTILLCSADITPCYVTGHVPVGLMTICACLIDLVVTIVHQMRNTSSVKERWLWCYWVILPGSPTIIFGIHVLISPDVGACLAPGAILTCLGMICYSTSSKM